MSRIYEGGGSDRRYEGRSRGASYQPRQVASNEKELRQQQERVLENLATRERERQRDDLLYNKAEATSAQVEMLQLNAQQSAAAAEFKMVQNAERFALQRAQLGEEQLLKETSMKGANSLANDILAMTQGVQNALLEQSQLIARNELTGKQTLDRGFLEINQDYASNKLNQDLVFQRGQMQGEQSLQNSFLKQQQLASRQITEQNQQLQASALEQNQQLKASASKQNQRLQKDSLKQNQGIAKGNLKQNQQFQRSSIKQTQLNERNKLKGQNSLNNSQLKANQKLSNDLLKSGQALESMQLGEKLGTQNSQLIANQNLQRSQTNASMAMKNDFLIANTELGAEARALSANQNIERAELQAQFASERAALSQQQAGISALMSFAKIGTDAADLVSDYNEQQEAAKAAELKQQEEKAGYEFLLSSDNAVIQPDGSVNPVIATEQVIQSEEVAFESGVQAVSGGDIQVAENIRQPLADQTMGRNTRQMGISEASMAFQGELDSRLSDPSYAVQTDDGRILTIGSVRNESELREFINGASRQITAEFGVSGRDSHAMLMSYGKKARAAINSAYSRYSGQIASSNAADRYDAALGNAASLVQTGNAQSAWNAARTGAVTSGKFFGQGNRAINDATLKDLMSRLPDDKLRDLLSVRKNPNQAGTEFGQDFYYRDMIQDEIETRTRETVTEFNTATNARGIQVKEIQNRTTMALGSVSSAEESFAIRTEAISELEQLNTPEAIDAINKLREKGGTNINAYLELAEGFDMGFPPSQSAIDDSLASGAISQQQYDFLSERGATSDVIDSQIKAAGLDIGKLAEGTVQDVLSGFAGLDATERKLAAGTVTANIKPRMEAELRAYIVNRPGATQGEIQQEMGRIVTEYRQRLAGPKGGKGDLTYDYHSGVQYNYNTDTVAPVLSRANPITGKAQRVYTQSNVQNIPTTASPTDVYLSKDEYLREREVWQSGGQGYSARTRAIAQKLNISPAKLVKLQTYALGYPDIETVPEPVASLPAGTISIQQGYQAIQSMGFPERGAAYLAGNIMQESSWNGQRSWGEVAGDGSDRNGGLVSWMDGVAHNNFRLTKIENYLGKPIDQASTAEQLQAMVWEMKRDYKGPYRTFMNPNSTDVQLRRASIEYWGYGHEGSRYSYAQQLLR